MFSSDGILGRNFAIATSALDGLAMRQQVHAENLANVNTPGYQAKTVEFERVLGSALSKPNPGMMYTTPLGPAGGRGSVADARTAAGLSSAFSTTNRTGERGVDKATETSKMMNDNIRFRVMSQQVTNSISSLRSVISEMGRG